MPLMTKKTFEAVAQIIANAARYEGSADHYIRMVIALQLAGLFASENPRFDRKKFMQACNGTIRTPHMIPED